MKPCHIRAFFEISIRRILDAYATSQVLTTDLPLTIHKSPTAWPYPLVGSGAFSFVFTHVDISRPIVLICRRTEYFFECWLYTAVLLSMKSS